MKLLSITWYSRFRSFRYGSEVERLRSILFFSFLILLIAWSCFTAGPVLVLQETQMKFSSVQYLCMHDFNQPQYLSRYRFQLSDTKPLVSQVFSAMRIIDTHAAGASIKAASTRAESVDPALEALAVSS